MSCGIYKWTSPNRKSYIGQSVNLECRKQEFINNKLYTSRNECSLTVIDKARKKYPDFEQWYYEILEYCEPNELNDREQYYINLYDTFKNGYNQTSGGGQNTEMSDETREKMSESHKGEKNIMYGKHHKEETIKKQSEIKKNINNPMYGKTPWNKGKTISDETKEKIRQASTGRIYSDETKEKIRQAHIGKTHSDETKEKIRQAHIGKTPWNKGKTLSDETREKIRQAQHSKQIDQYSLDGTFIKTWQSMHEIKRQLGFDISLIGRCCKGKKKTAYGFIWRYHN